MRPVKKAASLIAAASALLCPALLAAGCSEGSVLTKNAPEGFVVNAFHRDDGIYALSVSSGGTETFSRKITQSPGNRPYTSGDGRDYGLTVDDIDLDGKTDIAVVTSSRDGAEQYLFLFGDGAGGFTEAKELSKLKAPVFGKGDGLVYVYSETLEYESKGIPGQPDLYTERHMTVAYGRAEDGKFMKKSAEAVTFYSEENIYCLSEFSADPEAEDGLTEENEIWIQPEALADYGLEPFKFRG